MTPKERHFEFMKAAFIETVSSESDYRCAAREALLYADAALEDFEKRWPEEEKADNCHHLNRSKAAMADHPWHCNVCGKEF